MKQGPITPATLVQRTLAGHAAIGLLAGALMYITCLTGALIVIHDRWGRWEQPNAVETERLSPQAAQAAMRAMIASEVGQPRTTQLDIRMPSADLPRATVTTDRGGVFIDDTGRLSGPERHPWTTFLITQHETLHLPATWGLVAVGALGVMLGALCVTGVLAHPRLVRDAFRLRTRHGAHIARADWHKRLGVWILPFALAIAMTGSFLGLGNVGATMLASAYANGAVDKIYAPVFGGETTPDPQPGPLPNIPAALRTVAQHAPHAVPTNVIVHDPGTRGQHVQVTAEHPRRLIFAETYNFDPRGHWLGPLGLANGTVGQQAAASTFDLHFGNYGGVAIEILYMLCGLALCIINATGTSIWLQKRSRRGHRSERLIACWHVVVWGAPLALVWLLWLSAAAGPDVPLGRGFWLLLATGVAVAIIRPRWFGTEPLRLATLFSVMLTALLHLAILRPTAGGVLGLDAIAFSAAALRLILEASGLVRILRTRTAG